MLALWAGTVTGQESEPLAVLSTYTEAVAFDDDGNVYVSEPYSDTVSRITADGEVSAWAKTGAPNGHKVLPNGNHLLCDNTHAAVLLLDGHGTILRQAASECGDHPIRGPNDLTPDAAGGFYFTDPGIFPDSWEQPVGRVCYVGPNGESRVVLDGLAFPNGIVLEPGENRLLVAESKTERVVEYEVVRPGVVGSSQVLAEVMGDGITLDRDGNLYIANGRSGDVIVVDRAGTMFRTIPTGIGFVSNLAIGGAEQDWLYVSGSLNEWSGRAMDNVTRQGALARIQLTH